MALDTTGISLAGFGNLRPATNITPFTYRDGTTMLDMVYGLKGYIENEIVPAVETHGGELVGQVNDILDKMAVELSADREIQAGLHNEFTGTVTALVEAINNKTGPTALHRITLTANTVFSIDPVWPTLHPVAVQVVQDATGSRKLTFPPAVTSSNVVIAPDPGAITNFWLIPQPGNTWTAVQDVSRTDVTKAVTDAVTPVKETADAALPANQRGTAGGVASLGSDGLVPLAQLPVVAGSRSGTHEGRPAVATVRPGFIYYTVDTMETYVSNGTEWVSVGNGGSILGSSQLTSFVSTDTNAWVADLTVAFKGGNRPVEISLSCDLAGTEPGGDVSAEIYLNDVLILQIHHDIAYKDRWETKYRAVTKSVAPGSSNKVTVRLVKSWGSANNVKMGGSPTEPAVLTVRNG